jgi:hypothetical protein
MPKNTRAGSAMGKTSSRHPIQDWSNDDSDEDYMYLKPKPLAFAFPASPTSGISEDKVVNAEPLAQGTQGTHVSRKQGIRPRPPRLPLTNPNGRRSACLAPRSHGLKRRGKHFSSLTISCFFLPLFVTCFFSLRAP